MGKRGCPAIPPAIKIGRGTWTRYRDENKATLPEGIPQRPEWLDSFEREKWDEAVDVFLKFPGLLSEVDGSAVSMYVEAWSEFWTARAMLKSEGYIVNETLSPWYRVKTDAQARIMKWVGRFGLSPADRASLKLLPTDTGDKFAELDEGTKVG